jgi:outer membrane protein OmpA-like peptidoglycan-associated protein
MRKSLLALAISVALATAAHAQQAPQPPPQPSVPLSYVGTDTRISLGVDEDLDVLGEFLQVFGNDGDSAALVEGWIGDGGAGGLKFDWHWLWGGKTRADTIEAPDSVTVAKAFVAVDQNAFDDRKATLGIGFEREHLIFDTYVSGALTDERLVDSRTSAVTRVITGTQGGRPFRQNETTTTTIDFYEHPYDWGVGARLGRYFAPQLLRLRGGLDYERGDFDSDQTTFSVGLDKHIENSGHSFSLELEHYNRGGDFAFTDSTDTRAMLLWRYEIGRSFRAEETVREVQVPVTTAAAEPPAPQVIRNEVRMDSDAFFLLDRAELTADAEQALAALVDAIRSERRVSRVTVVGHTCDLGPDAYNQRLSERRAQTVRDFFAARGVDVAEIDASGAGESAPKFPNTPAERAKNRRVDVSFLTIEETTIPAPPAPPPETRVEWVREPVRAPAAWIERALRNPAEHKRTVDVYRFETTTETIDRGPIEFINRAPVAVDDALTVVRDAAATAVAVLANDTDPDGDTLRISAVATPANGTATISGSTVLYTPRAGYTGSDSFTYTIADPAGLTATATVVVTVNPPPNRVPVAANDSATVPGDSRDNAINVLANDSDPDGDTLTISAVGTPANGTATISGTRVLYTPRAGFVGTDSFTYTISDGRGGSAQASVTVTVTQPNRAPVAANDSASVAGDSRDNAINVLANDSDPDGDTLTISAVGTPANGTATIAAGRILYTPRAGFVGTDSFTYTVSDGRGGSAQASVTVTVTQPNRVPVAANDSASVLVDTRDNAINVLANDFDPDGDTLTISAVGTPANGTAMISGTRVLYTPRAGFVGADSFTYTISDGRGGSAQASVAITVTQPQPNRAPIAVDDNAFTPARDPVDVNVLANDSDPDGDVIRVTAVTQPNRGVVTINADGSVRFTPFSDWCGLSVFTYTISDTGGLTATARVIVQRTPGTLGSSAEDLAAIQACDDGTP